MDYRPIIEEIVMDEVEFYAHTVLRAGIVYGAWYKVGNSKEIGEGHKDVLFGTASDVRVLPNKELEFVSPRSVLRRIGMYGTLMNLLCL